MRIALDSDIQLVLNRPLSSKNRKGMYAGNYKDKFFRQISIAPSGCYLWTGVCNEAGYGRLYYDNGKKYFLAHRVAYLIANNKLEAGKVVMHTCDMPSCVNPEHLIQATQKDNIHDCLAKGRGRWAKCV